MYIERKLGGSLAYIGARGLAWDVSGAHSVLILTEQVHCSENHIYVFPEKELRGLCPNFHLHVCVINLYIPMIGSTYFPVAEQADRSWEL
jgi:hypothetical protein